MRMAASLTVTAMRSSNGDLDDTVPPFLHRRIDRLFDNSRQVSESGASEVTADKFRQDRFLNRGVLAHSPSVLQRGD